MAKMRAMVVRERGGPFVAEERDIPAPGPEEIRVRVEACGVCHSDAVTVQRLFPIVQYPRDSGARSHRRRRCDRGGRQAV